MRIALSTTYRTRMADALTGAAVPPPVLGPGCTAYVGNGAAGRDPRDSMYAPTQQATVQLDRNDDYEYLVAVLLPPSGAQVTLDEVGLFAPDGALILHATFTPQTLSAGVEAGFDFVFNPLSGGTLILGGLT